jgi:hypothetical protein
MNNPKIVKISLDYLMLLIKALFFNLTSDTVFLLIKIALTKQYQWLSLVFTPIYDKIHRNKNNVDFYYYLNIICFHYNSFYKIVSNKNSYSIIKHIKLLFFSFPKVQLPILIFRKGITLINPSMMKFCF